MTALKPVGGRCSVGAYLRHDNVRCAVCRARNACSLLLCANDDRMLRITEAFVRILPPAIHALNEVKRGAARIDLRHVNPCAVLLLLLRVVGRIAEAFVHDIGEIHEIAKRVPVVPHVEVGSDR